MLDIIRNLERNETLDSRLNGLGKWLLGGAIKRFRRDNK